jgi:phosphoglycolate phosphatase-like HAD superfamily hydrolase
MLNALRAVFFDVDGVLIDSLPQHLQICRDKASEFGLHLKIPDVEAFRLAVNRGTKISPMLDFFLAVGFPQGYAERAVADYEREFMEKYRPRAFEGVSQMLHTLRSAGLNLGIVTSNTRSNVVPALAESMQYFDESCLFFFDRYPITRSKSWCLTEGSRLLATQASNCAYVGDQPADAVAARDAGFKFLGVTYGWGIPKDETRFETVDRVADIPDRLLSMRVCPLPE